MLGTRRLVTLAGAGGVGKTRLAVEAAQQHAASFEQGVHFVSLAAVGSASLVASAIATALGVSFYGPAAPDVQLVSYLHDKHLLLLLDNFEHLLDGAGLPTDILSGAPAVTLLVTSRERLNLQEEWVLSIEGLPFPNRRDDTEPIDQYPAVQLFVQRARQVQAGFTLAENVQPVAAICQHSEGMPLALELAATWLRVMPCDQIAVQIHRSLDFLTTPVRNVPDRHRSLRGLRSILEPVVGCRAQGSSAALSISRWLRFGRRRAGVRASLRLLAALADKSLVRPTLSGRYDLHELVRQYLSEKLAEAGDTSAAARGHFAFYSRLADQAETHLYGLDQEEWFDRLEIEYDNLAAALTWSLHEEHAEAGLRLVAALGFFWEHRGHFHDGYEWFEKLLEIDGGAAVSVRAKALRTAGMLAYYIGKTEEGTVLCEEALALAREAGDQWNVAWSLAALGFFDPYSPHLSRAAGLLEEALRLFRALGDGWGISHALRRLGWIETSQGDYERAALLLDEALRLAREVHNQHALSWSLFLLGNVVWLQTRDPVRAMALYEESLSLVRQTRDQQNLGHVLIMLGQVAHAQGDYEQAHSRYNEVVGALRQARGAVEPPRVRRHVVIGFARLAVARGEPERAARLFGAAHEVLANPNRVLGDSGDLVRDVAAARAQLGEKAFDAGFAEGRSMTLEQALSCVSKAEN